MKQNIALLSLASVVFFTMPTFGTGCSAETDDPTDSAVTEGESQEALAPAIPIAGCLANPACAAAVAAAVGYVVWSVSDLSGDALRAAQRAANAWAASQSRACPPCPRPPANDSRYDSSHAHWPCKGAHTHHYTYRYNQNPSSCQCFLQKIETSVTCH